MGWVVSVLSHAVGCVFVFVRDRWKLLCEASRKEFKTIYDTLEVGFPLILLLLLARLSRRVLLAVLRCQRRDTCCGQTVSLHAELSPD